MAGDDVYRDTIRKVLAQADQLVGKARLEKILEAIRLRRPAAL